MRDTQGLRARIALLACVPGLLACSPPPRPQPVGEDEAGEAGGDASERRTARRGADEEGKGEVGERRKRFYEAKARREGKSVDEVTPPAQRAAERRDELRAKRREAAREAGVTVPPDGPTPTDAVAEAGAQPPGTVPGDPPFIDGYNPEEEHCISGNWCGAGDAARAIGVEGVTEEQGCPARIVGGKSTELIKGDAKTYAGLSSAPNMQGALNQHGTELRRAQGQGDTCCYHWFEYCSGRPHLGDDGPVLAPVEPGAAWVDDSAGHASPELPEALRACIAGAWLDDARAEHASVAAFARATLELMAVGAPPELLAQAQQAGLDEVDHARRCFGLAARYGAGCLQPGPLPPLGPRPADLAQLAADTFAEGCAGETIAALVAQRSLRHCHDPAVASTLRTIADDEARHAALAWSTVSWALRAGGPRVAERLRLVAQSLRTSEEAPLPLPDPDTDALALHGRLDARGRALAARDAWREVIGPMLDALLAEQPAPSQGTILA